MINSFLARIVIHSNLSIKEKSKNESKIKIQVQISVDGFIAGPNGEMDFMTWSWG